VRGATKGVDGGSWWGKADAVPPRCPGHNPVKRLVDLTAAVLAIAVLSIPMALVAAGVRLSLGRPILFRQERVGLGGARFEIVKFRSMRPPVVGTPVLPDETRLVPFGRLLRRTRLDELPEVLNVLRGEMSLVGPRPLVPATVTALGPLADGRARARPGLTGWAQVNGNTRLDDADKLVLDLWYIEHQSLRLDLYILLLTVGVVVFGERCNLPHIEKARRHACGSDRHG
jgi:lipopolysaccharide/colanic/teichoic acid biosynthesis glycosyltransferase